MGIESISAIIAIAVIVIGAGIILYKQPPARNPISYILIMTGVLLISISGFTKPQFNAVDWVQMGLTFGLLAITGMYAWSTQKQANASVRMAREMREQRLGEARPYLLLRLTNEYVQWGKIEPDKHPPTEFPVTIRNEGNGPAINVEASLWHSKTVHPCDRKGYLARGEEWQATISKADVGIPYKGEEEVRSWLPELRKIIKQDNPAAVVVKYRDIHKRNWLSYLCLEWHGDVPFVMDGEQNILEGKKND